MVYDTCNHRLVGAINQFVTGGAPHCTVTAPSIVLFNMDRLQATTHNWTRPTCPTCNCGYNELPNLSKVTISHPYVDSLCHPFSGKIVDSLLLLR